MNRQDALELEQISMKVDTVSTLLDVLQEYMDNDVPDNFEVYDALITSAHDQLTERVKTSMDDMMLRGFHSAQYQSET